MKKMLLAVFFLVTACGTRYPDVVVRPENLINASAEKISFPISDKKSVAAIVDWIRSGDVPSAAAISCDSSAASCIQVENILKKRNIPFEKLPVTAGEVAGSVSLTYDRLTANSCPLIHLGCATSLNSVRMVANRDQFVKPVISDLQDASSAVRAVSRGRY